MKIAMLFPYTPSYRDLIYRKMDEELDVDWFFCGNAERPMKLMDYSLLKRCDLSMREKQILGPIHQYEGIKKLKLDKYDAIIAPSVIRCTSTWWLVRHFGGGGKGPKVYFWTHGWYGKERGLMKLLKKVYYSKVDGFFLYNCRGKGIMLKMGYDESKLHVVYNSLNYDAQLPLRQQLRSTGLYREHFNNNNKNIVFIGRLITEKRFDLLLDAVSLLKKRGVHVNVTFIGDGIEHDNMVKRVNELGINNQVWFYGACFDEKTNAELIYNADLCVSPGNIGLTAIHVLMFGCPAITSDDYMHQGPEFEAIQNGQTGAFFKAGDYLSLADSISKWFLDHNTNREEVREKCYAEIDSHWNPEYQLSVIKNALGIQPNDSC